MQKNFAKDDDTQEDSQRGSSEDNKNKNKNEKKLDGITPRSIISQKKDSRIPRAKGIKSPVVVQISRDNSVKRLSLTSSKKSFDTISRKKDMKEVLKTNAYPKYVFQSNRVNPSVHLLLYILQIRIKQATKLVCISKR